MMTRRLEWHTVIWLYLIVMISADYQCVCNYSKYGVPVYQNTTRTSVSLGIVDVDVCKQYLYTTSEQSTAFYAIMFRHQIGFVMDIYITKQNCQGTPPVKDIDDIGQNRTIIIKTVETVQTNTTGTQYTTTSNELYNFTSVSQGHVELCPNRIQHLAKLSGELLAQLGQNCYEVVQTAVSWSHAEANCKRNRGHLVHITNQQEQDFINNFLVKNHSRAVWLGLHDRNQEESFEWTAGNTVTYTNWKPRRKDDIYHDSEDCVFMTPSTGQWDDVQCGGDDSLSELFHAYICQYATIDASVSGGNIYSCPYKLHQQVERERGILVQHDHSCYELVADTKVAWQNAEDLCHSRGGHLAYISNLQEQAFIQRFLNRYSPSHAVWIGLTDHNSEGHFQWTSGAPVHFTNWIPGHMSNNASSSQENCVAFIPYKGGKWDEIPCESTHHSIFSGTSSSGEIHPLLCQYRISSGPSLIG
ncbi:macrophage mannose receptor 1-like [Mercenaria mercenaria]|uniref:macrophage mannose receptor 1-like n=1 Tax=Mercenaria mercenaria TaxID=6596 RepID=UPI00234E73D9|nr:macrophage mannose receptor 1-like [Mercenaria mercenaria]